MSIEFDKTKYYGHPEFYKIVEELKELHSRKNFQYATSDNPLANFQRCGNLIKKLLKPSVDAPLADAMILMSKQIDAVYEMVGEGKTGTEEEIVDKFRDIAVYSIISMILLKEKQK